MEQYFKVLASDGCSPHHGGSGKWFVPSGKRSGKWMPKIKNIEPCSRGYHFVNLFQLSQWLGPTIYRVEIRGKVIAASDKSVAEQARLIERIPTWNEKTQRLFAADCAEHVLHLFEKKYPSDLRVRNAISVIRKFADGQATLEELNAAYAAANAAAYAADAATANATAAANAAYAAANAANAAYAADDAYAANAAAAAYAADAATSAADAANAANAAYAERKWQADRLAFYLEL